MKFNVSTNNYFSQSVYQYSVYQYSYIKTGRSMKYMELYFYDFEINLWVKVSLSKLQVYLPRKRLSIVKDYKTRR